MSIEITKPKSIQQIADKMEMSKPSAIRWIKFHVPEIIYIEGKRKKIYTPKEVKLIYKEYGLLED